MTQKGSEGGFVLCIRNDECDDLERGKVYPVWPDPKAAKEGYVRVVDESGEDYLYPESSFVVVKLPRRAQAALAEVEKNCRRGNEMRKWGNGSRGLVPPWRSDGRSTQL